MNWRNAAFNALAVIPGDHAGRQLRIIQTLTRQSRDEMLRFQRARLERLILHAWRECPYYKAALSDVGVCDGRRVRLDRFERIPVLTKDIIRREGAKLYARTLTRRARANTSGGSTGEPTVILQDTKYRAWNSAAKLYFGEMAGKRIGEPELKIWGSERDVLEGTVGLRNRAFNALFNRRLVNSFVLTDRTIDAMIASWRSRPPRMVWAYVDSMLMIAKKIRRRSVLLPSPRSIVVTAGVLTEPVRARIEETFRAPVLNQYGSRETGVIACECIERKNMHIFDFFHSIELESASGPESPVLVTNLANYAMPLLRYRIGDTARAADRTCDCGRSLSLIGAVSGRISDHLIALDGSLVHGEFFTHLFYFQDWVTRFQVVQTDYDRVECRIAGDEDRGAPALASIRQSIQTAMGRDCRVDFLFVDSIAPTASGKYRYTICCLGDDPESKRNC